MGYAKRTDFNQSRIVERFRSLGCQVFVTSSLGKGFVDLVVKAPYSHRALLVEVKDGSKPPSQQKLTPDEIKFHNDWFGCVHIIKSEDEATELVMKELGIK